MPIFLLALGALFFCLWALQRHYSIQAQPMLVPVRPAPTYDVDAGERPVPDLPP